MITFGSLFAGIGGFEKGLEDVGFSRAWSAEQDAKCNSVRRRHWPDERTINCVTAVRGSGFGCDLITAGWPCQGNSVAGRRAGMADERSGLWSEVRRILAEQRPAWFLGENVPGILSVNGGQDWLTVLRNLAELGYGTAYRVLDAQWFGVPQRRRRVFVVGCLGDWRRAAEVLFESESLPWDTPPSRKAGAEIARTIAAGAHPSGFNGRDAERGNIVAGCHGGFRTEPGEHVVARPLAFGRTLDHYDESQQTYVTHSLTGEGFDASEDGTGRGTPIVPMAFDSKQSGEGGEVSPPLRALNHDKSHANAGGQVAMSYGFTLSSDPNNWRENGACPLTLRHGDPGNVATDQAVRRLTPRECERLQGFPDDWTRYGEHGEEIADGPRYWMLGNAVAVPCIRWIGRQLINLLK